MRIMENMKAFAIVEYKDKLPLSWNKDDQAVLPPTEFTQSSHKAAEWAKRWRDLFIFFMSTERFFCLGFSDILEVNSRR